MYAYELLTPLILSTASTNWRIQHWRLVNCESTFGRQTIALTLTTVLK
jgi:hypothetical protein